MQKGKRVEHHDCCATCIMHETDTEIDTYGSDYWYCLENSDLDCDGYPDMRYHEDDTEQFRLKFFMVCDLYAQPPTPEQLKKAIKAKKEQEQS